MTRSILTKRIVPQLAVLVLVALAVGVVLVLSTAGPGSGDIEAAPAGVPETPPPTKQPDPGDTDGDGCSDEQENGPNQELGGRRDYLNPWDFYDVNGDLSVSIPEEILPIAAAFGPSTGPNYTTAKDRTSPPTADEEPDPAKREPWDLGPPDGTINIIDDILGAARQFGHNCFP